MKKVSIDFDEVLYGLHEAHAIFLKEEYGVDVKRKDVTDWNYLIDNYPNITEVWSEWNKYIRGDLLEGSIGFVKKVNELFGIDNVKIVTATHTDIIKEKDVFVKEHFDNEVIHSCKQKFLYTKDSILLDDHGKNIIDHVRENSAPGIIFDQGYGWNQNKAENHVKDIYRAASYDEVLYILKHVKG